MRKDWISPAPNNDSIHLISFQGFLSASVHGTKELSAELAINLDLFRKAYFESTHHCSSSSLFPFIEYLKSGKIQWNRHQATNEPVSDEDATLIRSSILRSDVRIKRMKSSKKR